MPEPTERRKIENQLLAMGLPDLNDAALVQVMADIVNGYPLPRERVEFFCDLLNQCEGTARTEMYNAMRPKLSFPVPSLFDCESLIAQKAERLIRPGFKTPGTRNVETAEPKVDACRFISRQVHVACQRCNRVASFEGLTTADAVMASKQSGWGTVRTGGILDGERKMLCPVCRLDTMKPMIFGVSALKEDATRNA